MVLRGGGRHVADGRGTWLERIPVLRRLGAEVRRVEPIDRTMVIAAQAVLALLPLLVVLTAFLPQQVVDIWMERLQAVTGVGGKAVEAMRGSSVAPREGDPSQATENVTRSEIGVLGAVVTVLSTSSFALAVQRMYEQVWDVARLPGLRARRRCLVWLMMRLVALHQLGLLAWAEDGGALSAPAPLWFACTVAGPALLWWWTPHMLLSGRVAWRDLAISGGLTGFGAVAYMYVSSAVLPVRVQASIEQFGSIGPVLILATWMVGFTALIVGTAMLGRALTIDPTLRGVLHTSPSCTAMRQQSLTVSEDP